MHAWSYFAFERLLRWIDDRRLPLVEKICSSMGFWANRKPPSSRQGPDRRLFFCAAFHSYYGSKNNSQKTPTKSLNSHQKTQQ